MSTGDEQFDDATRPRAVVARCSWTEAAFHALSDALLVALGIAGPTLLFIDFNGQFAAVRNVLLVSNVALCSLLFAALRTVRLRRASPEFLRSAALRRSRLALLLAVSLLTAILCAIRMVVARQASNAAIPGLFVSAATVALFASWRLRQLSAGRER